MALGGLRVVHVSHETGMRLRRSAQAIGSVRSSSREADNTPFPTDWGFAVEGLAMASDASSIEVPHRMKLSVSMRRFPMRESRRISRYYILITASRAPEALGSVGADRSQKKRSQGTIVPQLRILLT